MKANPISLDYFQKDVLEIAPLLVGKCLMVRRSNLEYKKFIITETEAYRGEEDLACHACKGRTQRTEVMYGAGGNIYVYLIYGMYWMLNIVTGKTDHPQAVLIRGVEGFNGPGKLTRNLGIDGSFNKKPLVVNTGIWIEESGINPKIISSPRIGIDYAGDIWKNKPWRFTLKEK